MKGRYLNMKKLKALTILNLIILTVIISSVTIKTAQPNADMNQDGVLDADDLAIIKAYIIYE